MASLILHRAGGSGVGSGDCTGTRAIVLADSGTVITVDSGDVPASGSLPKSAVLADNGGTMVNRGAVSPTGLNCGGSYTIPAGYHNGSGYVTANSLSSQTGVDNGKTAVTTSTMLTGYQGWVNGNKVTGAMVNRGAVSPTGLNCGGSYTIPAGYHNGSGQVTANSLASQTSGTASAGLIRSGYTAWVNGSQITGTLADYDGSVS